MPLGPTPRLGFVTQRLGAAASLALRLGALAGVAGLALAAPACRRGSGPPPERFLSARTEVALVVPDLRRLGEELGTLQETASRFPGTGSMRQLRAAVAGQLGFDPLDPDAVAKAGLEPSRGIALGLEPPLPNAKIAFPRPVAILPVRDAAALEETVGRVARERLGASRRAESSVGELRVVTFRTEDETAAEPSLALAFRSADRTAALSPGPHAVEAAAGALSRAPAESLGESQTFRAQRKALGERYALLVAVAPRGPFLALGGDLLAGVSAEAGLVRLGLALHVGESGSALRGAGKSSDALRALSPDAPLVLRWDGDPAGLGHLVLPAVAKRDRAWLAEHGLDLQKDVFDLLAPGAAASLSLSPRVQIAGFDEDEVRADPLRLVRFELAAEVKDEARAGQVLARLPALLAAVQGPGAKPGSSDAAGRRGRIPTPSGELAWRLEGKRLFLAGGAPGAIDALAARGGAGGAAPARSDGFVAPTKAARAALSDGLGGAVLAPRALAASVRALPDDAYGTDPTGFLLRSLVEGFVAPLDRLLAVSARAELVGDALVIDARIEAAPPEKREKPEKEEKR